LSWGSLVWGFDPAHGGEGVVSKLVLSFHKA
jgi:hypothetical protein